MSFNSPLKDFYVIFLDLKVSNTLWGMLVPV